MSSPQPERRPQPVLMPQPQLQRAPLLSRRSLLIGAGVVGAVAVAGGVSQIVGGGSAGGPPGQLRPGGDPNNWLDYYPSEPGPTGSRFQPVFDLRAAATPEGAIVPVRENPLPETAEAWRTCAPGRDALNLPAGSAGLELCICLDTTGSMGGVLEAAKSSIQGTLRSVAATGPLARVAVILYRDYGDDYVTRTIGFRPALDPELMAFVGSARVQGGADWPEALGAALVDATRLDWSSRPGLVVVIADAPGHDYDAGMISGAVRSLAGSGRRVSVIDSGAAGLQALAAAGGGSYVAWRGDLGSALNAAICQ